MTLRVLKWNVPVDDQPHKIGTGRIAHVACQVGPESVQIWTVEVVDGDSQLEPWKPVQVFGTGQPVPRRWAHVGSAFAAGGALVWHVFEAPPEQWAPAREVTL